MEEGEGKREIRKSGTRKQVNPKHQLKPCCSSESFADAFLLTVFQSVVHFPINNDFTEYFLSIFPTSQKVELAGCISMPVANGAAWDNVPI